MTDLPKISRDMIRTYLEDEDIGYSIENDGQFVFEYDYEERCQCELRVWLDMPGEDTLTIDISNDRSPSSPAVRDHWLNLCNEWNSEQAYPWAYLHPDEDEPSEFDVRLSFTIIAKPGVTQEQIKEVTEEVIEGAFGFWMWTLEATSSA